MPGSSLCAPANAVLAYMQRFFGTAVGKGRQAAKTEIERLKLREIACEQGINEVAKMCARRLLHPIWILDQIRVLIRLF